jgi:hypothetical protein
MCVLFMYFFFQNFFIFLNTNNQNIFTLFTFYITSIIFYYHLNKKIYYNTIFFYFFISHHHFLLILKLKLKTHRYILYISLPKKKKEIKKEKPNKSRLSRRRAQMFGEQQNIYSLRNPYFKHLFYWWINGTIKST